MKVENFENEEFLLASLRKGDEKAYLYLFKKYYDSLFNYAGRVVHDSDTARDVVQDVFCRFYEYREKIKIKDSIKYYLYRAVYNRSLDVLKHEDVRRVYQDKMLFDFYEKEVAMDPEGELKLRREEIQKAIAASLDKLPERCRQIFVMKKIDEYSNQEIADKLGVSVKTVESQMRIALRRLRKDLGWLYYLIFVGFFLRIF